MREAFVRLFHALPEFHERYPDIGDPVRNVAFPNGSNQFAFVEFFDEVLTATAVLMSGFELGGRNVKVSRPQAYVPAPYGELPPLDVEPLRRNGFLPAAPDVVSPHVKNSVSDKLRELYFGNLEPAKVTEARMVELLTPACLALPEFDATHGPPITKVQLAPSRQFAFVVFQGADMASRAIAIFDKTDFFGRKLNVKRPDSYYQTIQQTQAAQAAPSLSSPVAPPTLQLMLPPKPSSEGEAFRAVGGAVASLGFDTLL